MYKISSIGMSFMYNWLTSGKDVQIEDTTGNDSLITNANRLKVLRSTLEEHGGLFSKVAQMLSYGEQDCSVFSECKPYSREATVKYLETYLENNEVDYDIDINIFKSGSIGQVHIGKLSCGDKIAVKVQYFGLYEQTEEDIKALSLLSSFLYCFADVKEAIKEIKKKVYDELDYEIETFNHKLMYNNWKNSDVYIPKVYENLCTNKILVTEFIEGVDLSSFINNSSQEYKNKIGMDIARFIFTNIYEHNIFYSDCHYGNIIICDDNQLAVIDFGCINYIESETVVMLKHLHIALKEHNKDDFMVILTNLGIINDNVSNESRDYAYEYFQLQYQPWIIEDEFEFTEEWWKKSDMKNVKLMSEWVLPSNMVYFNKIPYGLYNILTSLNATGNFYTLINSLI